VSARRGELLGSFQRVQVRTASVRDAVPLGEMTSTLPPWTSVQVRQRRFRPESFPSPFWRAARPASEPPPSVLLEPRIGEDACAIEVPGGVLVAATDPITLTTHEIGRFSVIVNANDVAVMGVRPRWFLAVIWSVETTMTSLWPCRWNGDESVQKRERGPGCRDLALPSLDVQPCRGRRPQPDEREG